MKLTIEIAGDKQLEREFLRVGERAGDASPAFEAILGFIEDETREQFDTQGAHASGGWKPIKEATLRRKRAQGLDPRILHATHALRQSLTVRHDPNAIRDVRPDGLDYGSKLPYAGAHQKPRPGSRLPQRRPVELTENARREIVRKLQRFLLAGETG